MCNHLSNEFILQVFSSYHYDVVLIPEVVDNRPFKSLRRIGQNPVQASNTKPCNYWMWLNICLKEKHYWISLQPTKITWKKIMPDLVINTVPADGQTLSWGYPAKRALPAMLTQDTLDLYQLGQFHFQAHDDEVQIL